MGALIWIGAWLTLAGVIGLLFCVHRVWRARRAGLDDDALRAVLQRVVALNMAALGLSVLGLACVIMGLVLG